VKAVAALAVVAIALAGCGEEETATSPAAADTELTLRLDTGDGEVQEASLTCPGGDADACAAIDALPEDPTAAVPADTACTQVYGGPTTLSVEGTLRGEDVSAVFDRTDGCQIERFDRFSDVLTAVFPDYDPTGGVDVN
jgi:hypothetical protein